MSAGLHRISDLVARGFVKSTSAAGLEEIVSRYALAITPAMADLIHADDPNDPINPVAVNSVTWVNSSDTAVVGATATQQSNFLFAPKYARILLSSGTGTVKATFLQSSNGPI